MKCPLAFLFNVWRTVLYKEELIILSLQFRYSIRKLKEFNYLLCSTVVEQKRARLSIKIQIIVCNSSSHHIHYICCTAVRTVKNACFVWKSSTISGWECSSRSLEVWAPALSLRPYVKRTLVNWSPPDGKVSWDVGFLFRTFIICSCFKYCFKCGFMASQDV